MRALISALMLTWSILAVTPAFAGPPGVKLVVSPRIWSFGLIPH